MAGHGHADVRSILLGSRHRSLSFWFILLSVLNYNVDHVAIAAESDTRP